MGIPKDWPMVKTWTMVKILVIVCLIILDNNSKLISHTFYFHAYLE